MRAPRVPPSLALAAALARVLVPVLAPSLAEAGAPEPAPSAEQPEAVAVMGVVKHATSGERLEDVAVSVRLESTDELHQTQTDARGIYSLTGLDPGHYEILVRALGRTVSRWISLEAGVDLRAHFVIDPETHDETINFEKAKALPLSSSACYYTINGCECGPWWRGRRRTFELGRSLFDDGGRREIEGGPEFTRRLP